MWLVTCAIVGGLTLPLLIQDGMFMDALLYTSVANNLSTGYGTFWFPQFSLHNVSDFNAFHEQPPLGIFIQSLFFRAFGHSMYVERFYTFLMLIITARLMVSLWKRVYLSESILHQYSWLPVLLWMLSPICFWSYSNNMLENTMGVFTLSAVILLFDAMRSQKTSKFILGGLFIFLATMIKGVPGLFPLATPCIIWIMERNSGFVKMIWQSFLSLITVALLYCCMLLIPDARESYDVYFLQRTLFRIDSLPTVNSRFYILGRLFLELLPQFILLIIVLLIARNKKRIPGAQYFKQGLIFILIGISASLPLMLTMVQKAFYFVPALPLFAIGLASMMAPVIAIENRKENLRPSTLKVWRGVGVLLFIGMLGYTGAMFGHVKRDKDLIHDVRLIGDAIPNEHVIGTPNAMWNNWSMQTYMMRYNNMSMDEGYKQTYVVVDQKYQTQIPEFYTKIDIPTKRYHLFKRKESGI
ncbi:MAG TPA: glycosyltransferase family 39 protein [Chitinophagales bacterium]|nr:glycosyltransferase family 39 protein [Chitinophagales bacterium]